MDTGSSTTFKIRDRSDVGHVRRWVANHCRTAGFGESEVGRAEVIVQEGLRNMVKFAGYGTFIGRMAAYGERPIFEALFVDLGPGMVDPFQCMRDGFSTGGSAGEGLGSMQRLSDAFDFYSAPEQGTVILSRIAARKSDAVAKNGRDPVWGVVCDPVRGESVCGDSWVLWREDNRWSLLVADGLGHGAGASHASKLACEVAPRVSGSTLQDLFKDLDVALHGSRGAAVTVCRWGQGSGTCEISGVGNVAAALIANERSRPALIHNGIVGHQLRKCAVNDYPWTAGNLLVCTTDGIRSRWDLSKYPGLLRRDPAVVAAVIYRDFRRERDDAAVVVVRCPEEGAR